jgi:S-adenosylmethionine:tRNA ribosyltransferase-isomerase
MKTTDFDYFLPEELIAQHPLDKRDDSRLLVIDKDSGKTEHKKFSDIIDYLDENDFLVINSTRVLPARLMGTKKETGAKAEVFLLHPSSEEDTWECLVRPGKKLKEGTIISFGDNFFSGEVLSRTETGGRIIKFNYKGSFMEAISKIGEVPLPPYIKEKIDDPERYQTVYAKNTGSVAAPTAGLHFTKELFEKIKNKKIEIAEVTLHVGLGTFRPVSADNILEHKMHAEFFTIDNENTAKINNALKNGKRIIAVGTTSTRTLESAVDNKQVVKQEGWTEIFIYPGYEFKATNALITNFHLPKSTLLMLVSALAGRENILKAYSEAVQEKYRFFSFGDAMFIK